MANTRPPSNTGSPQGISRPFRKVGDFYSPFFRVDYLNTTGERAEIEEFRAGKIGTRLIRFDLAAQRVSERVSPATASLFTRQFQFSAVNSAMDDLVTNIVASLKAEVVVGGPYEITITLNPEYSDALQLLNGQMLGYATLLRVSWGYRSSTGEEIASETTVVRVQYPSVTFDENITITLRGRDLSFDELSRVTDNGKWPKGTALIDIVRFYLGKVGYDLSDQYLAELVLYLGSDHQLFAKIEEDFIQQLTDWGTVHQLLRSVNLSFIIRNEKFSIFDIARPIENQLTYTFKWRQQLTKSTDIPVEHVDANYLDYMFAPATSRGLMTIYHDPTTNEWKAKIKDSSSSPPSPAPKAESNSPTKSSNAILLTPLAKTKDRGTGEASSGDQSKKTNDVGAKASTTAPTTGDTPDHVDSLIRDAEILSHPIIKLRSRGVVDLFPGMVVKLEGTTAAFDDVYTVRSVAHQISTDGYGMEVELYRRRIPKSNAPPAQTKPVSDGQAGRSSVQPQKDGV